ncbi:MAG: ATP-binding protein [Prolixibacteraceae bacterium]|jgi:PAS domain S-box-containing protein|nr:ATP-binding protein [Prolixibacteraceae bacterium]
MHRNENKSESAYLRQKAEKLLKGKRLNTNSELFESDMLKLIHELEVYQIELEMQNEELVLAKEEAEIVEKKYIELYDYAPSGYLTLTANGEIAGLNYMALRILGQERSVLIDNKFRLFITEGTRYKFDELFKHVFTSEVKQVCEVIIASKDNGPVYVKIDGIISLNDKQCFMTLTDITKRKIIELDNIKAKEVAEQATRIAETAKAKAEHATRIAEDAVRAKQQFLSNMSHEIRTPMNAIIGFTKVLLKTDLSSKQKEYLNAIKLSGDSLIVLINDILDLAKVDAGKMVFEQIPFKMANSISSIHHLFELKIQEKNIKLIEEYDSGIPEVLVGDPVRLHQIILNLLSNAVKFTSQGEIVVKVHMLEEDDEKVNIEFVVSDTGIGIAEDKLDKIFENFQQAYSGSSRLFGGTGLGLAIVKQLVEPQGGTIHVESKINEGSTFRFNLDFKKTDAEPEYETDIVEIDFDVKSLKILVVEDIVLNQLLMKTVLEDFGFACDIAGNGKIAVEKLKTRSYDIILMDLHMPEMNGFKAAKHIRTIMNLNVPIIALTADVTTVDLAKCEAAGMDDYIAKPVDERLLYNKIVGLVKKTFKDTGSKHGEEGETQKLKCINLDYLIRRTKSNPELMMQMISLYLEQTPPLISTMKQSLLNEDWDLLYASMHKIIPSFSIMGINGGYENIAKQIQNFASNQLESDEIPDLVFQVESVCKRACNELEIELNSIKDTLNEKRE